MFEEILSYISGFVLSTIESWGYWGIFLLMLLESANIPIPSEIIMPFSGFLVASGKFGFWTVVFVGALGNLVGSLINYYFAYHYGRKSEKILSKLGFISAEDFEIAEAWFKKFGLLSAFMGRLLPIVRTFISFPAGIFKVNVFKFSILTFLGSFLWSTVLTWAGFVTGENWNFLEPYFRRVDIIIAVCVLAAIGWIIYRRLSRRMIK